MKKEDYTEKNIKIYCGDSLALLKDIKDETVDLIFADPPYFLSNGGITCHAGKMVSVDKGKWDQLETYKQIEDFNHLWLIEAQRILKQNGTIWISGTHHNIYSIGNAMKNLGYKFLNVVTWEKPNPPPNLSCRYFTHSTEQILWCAKNEKSKHLYNYPIMKKLNKNKQMKDVWQMTAPAKNEKRFGKHPTQKPEKLLDRIITASSKKGNLILDPFQGTGTTAVMAKRLKRKYIGIEIDKKYITITKKRLKEEENN